MAFYTKVYNKNWEGSVLTNYTKQWAGNTSFMGGLEYLKMYAQNTFINFATAFSDSGGAYGIGLVDYAQTYTGDVNFEGAAAYAGDFTYTKTYTKIYTAAVDFAGTQDFTKI